MHEDADSTATATATSWRAPLDAYPRLCGLPVTIERLVPDTVLAVASEARAQPPGPSAQAGTA